MPINMGSRQWAAFSLLFLTLVLCNKQAHVASFTLDDLQRLTVGPLASQTALNICSPFGPPPLPSLSGPIPPEIGNLTNLTVLWICHYNLSGGIPPEIGKLGNLTELNLGYNNLTGGLPSEVGGLIKLQKLNLNGNRLSGPIPPNLGNLTSLTVLNLGRNRLNGSIPAALAGMSSLLDLELYENNLTGPVPVELANLLQLTVMGLQFNQLSGGIPPEFVSLTQLTALALQNNQLSGPIPAALGNMVSLTNLFLWNNSLSGSIPPELGSATRLTSIFLNNNSLSGPIPPTLGQLTNLQYLVLERNNISGSIPAELGALTNLLTLSLGNNQLSGPIPPQLAQLTSLNELYLLNNNLSGPIPPQLGNLADLSALLLSQNHLTGPVPPELANPLGLKTLTLFRNNLTGTISSGFLARFGSDNVLPGNTGLSVTSTSSPPANSPSSTIPPRSTSPPPPNPPLSPPPPGNSAPPPESSSSPVGIIAGAAAGAICAALIGIIVGCILYRRHKRPPPMSAGDFSAKEMSLPMHSSAGSGASRRPGSAYWNHAFTLAELRAATGGWAQANVVGSGSFGTVYRATLDDWSVVAVKRLDQRRRTRGDLEEQSWRAELATLSEVRHKNLVRLLGSCVDDGERLLVLEFFPEGSLGARLHYASQGKVAFLSWAERMAVIAGVCRGLTYMHHDIHPPLIHRDIKAANILLRGGTKGACIADFGLARLMQDDESGGDTSSAVKGTLPYMAPEYMQGGYRCLSPKCDVYSFGVVVLELVTGRPVTARFERGGRDIPLVELAASLVREQKALEMIDPAVWDAFDVSEAECCIQIALQCLQRDPSHRPTMEQVGIRLRTRGAEPRGSEVGSESPHDVLSGLTRGDPGRSMAGWDTGSSSGFSSGAYRFLTAR